MIRIFRKAVADEGFTAGPIKLKNTDLNRVHGIVREIDSRRVFYNSVEDELPEYARKSVNEARAAIRSSIKGVWADRSVERIIQELLRVLADFESVCERISPFPSKYSDENFDNFIEAISHMRLRTWSLIAFLKLKNGKIIQPYNMPEEIFNAVVSAGPP